MRLLRYATVALVLVLAVTGIAIAAVQGRTTKKVAASFATTPQRLSTETCTGADGSYTVTEGTYKGTVSGTLTGGVTETLLIHARSVVNQTTGDGTTVGRFHIKNGDSRVAEGSLGAVDSGSGSLNGFLFGRLPGASEASPPQRLLANFTATLGTGALNGQIGGGGAMTNSAVEQGGSCLEAPRPKPESDNGESRPASPRPPHPARD
jgi:hypothetical protein